MERFAEAGFQLATHTIGDAAARFTLGAYLRAGAAHGVRHRLEHLETLPDDLVRSIPAAGVVASMQPVHLTARARRRHRQLERAARAGARRARVPDARPARRGRGARAGLATGRWPTPTRASASPPPSCGGSRQERAVVPEQAMTARGGARGLHDRARARRRRRRRGRAHPRRDARRPHRPRRRPDRRARRGAPGQPGVAHGGRRARGASERTFGATGLGRLRGSPRRIGALPRCREFGLRWPGRPSREERTQFLLNARVVPRRRAPGATGLG